MVFYGTAILSACLVTGLVLGKSLGLVVGLDANVGGVGIAMLLLIVACDRLHATGKIKPMTERGIAFWGAIYIPVVVAMAASQNVIGALKGGPVAIVAGVLAVVACYALVPMLSKIGGELETNEPRL